MIKNYASKPTAFEEIIIDVGALWKFMPDAGIVSYYDNLPEENEFLKNIERFPSLTIVITTPIKSVGGETKNLCNT